MQRDISRRYRPPDAPSAAPSDDCAVLPHLFEHFRRFVAVELPHVAAWENGDIHRFSNPLLAVDDAQSPHIVAKILAAARLAAFKREFRPLFAVQIVLAVIRVADIRA